MAALSQPQVRPTSEAIGTGRDYGFLPHATAALVLGPAATACFTLACDLVDYRSGPPPDTFSHSEGFVYSPVVSGAKTPSLAPKKYSKILIEYMIKHRKVETWGRNLPLQPLPEGMPIVAPLPLQIISQSPYYIKSF